MQDVVLQQTEALCLVALRETASHVLNYGLWVAMAHLQTYMDIPAVASCCDRIHQALQLGTQLAIDHGETQKYTRDAAVSMNANAEKLKAVQRCRKARVSNSQCDMWDALCDAIKNASCHRAGSHSQTCLLVVDSAALEIAFQVVTAAGLKISRLQVDSKSAPVSILCLLPMM